MLVQVQDEFLFHVGEVYNFNPPVRASCYLGGKLVGLDAFRIGVFVRMLNGVTALFSAWVFVGDAWREVSFSVSLEDFSLWDSGHSLMPYTPPEEMIRLNRQPSSGRKLN